MTVEKEVLFRLSVRNDGKAARAFKEVGDSAEKSANQAIRAERQYRSALASSGGIAAGGGSALPGTGAASAGQAAAIARSGASNEALLRAGLKAFAAFRLAQVGVAGAANIAQAQTAYGLSDYDRDRKTKEALPILGGFVADIFKLVDAVSGYDAKLAEATAALRRAAALDSINAELRSTNIGSQTRGEYANIAASNFAATRRFARNNRGLLTNPLTGNAVADRFLLENPSAQQGLASVYEQQLLARNAAETAERQAGVAQFNATSAVGRIGQVPWRFLPGNIPSAEQGFTQDQVNQSRINARQVYEGRLQDRANIARQLAEAEKAIGEATAKQVEAVTKRNELAKADLAVAKAKRDILQQQKQAEMEALKAGAQAFGFLRPNERQFALQAAQRLRTAGLENLSDAERDILSRAGVGSALNKYAEKAGLANPLYQQLQQIVGGPVGLDRFENVRQLNIDLEKLRPQIELKVILDEEKLAQKLKDIVNEGEKKVRDIAAKKAENAQQAQEEKERAARIGINLGQ